VVEYPPPAQSLDWNRYRRAGRRLRSSADVVSRAAACLLSRRPRYSRGSYAYAWESLAGVWVYSFFSLLLTGWLSCPISAAICWTGLALYLRRLESPLPQQQFSVPVAARIGRAACSGSIAASAEAVRSNTLALCAADDAGSNGSARWSTPGTNTRRIGLGRAPIRRTTAASWFAVPERPSRIIAPPGCQVFYRWAGPVSIATPVRRRQSDRRRVGHTMHLLDNGRQVSGRRPCCHRESASECRFRGSPE